MYNMHGDGLTYNLNNIYNLYVDPLKYNLD